MNTDRNSPSAFSKIGYAAVTKEVVVNVALNPLHTTYMSSYCGAFKGTGLATVTNYLIEVCKMRREIIKALT